MTLKTALLSALFFAGASFGASAAPITAGSVINFAGQSTCTATTCSFGSAFVTSGTGSFSGFTLLTPATFNTITFSPFTSQQVYTSTAGSLTTTFTVTSQMSQSTVVVAGLTNVNITDLGTATLTGFDPTPGSFTFTANQAGTLQGSFSATTTATPTAVPEPASLAVLGLGLVGVGMLRHRRS